MARILVTRPRDDSERMAARLRECGYETVMAPLLELIPFVAPRPLAGGVRAVMLTSHNVFVGLEARSDSIKDLLRKPCYCVGARTAQAARVFGFHDVITADGDGRALAATIRDSLAVRGGGYILHPCGTETAPHAARILQAIGYQIRTWPVYSAKGVDHMPEAAQMELRSGQIAAALFFSPRTAAVFADLVRQNRLEACCASLIAIGLSEAVAANLAPLSCARVAVATTTTEAAMIACLRAMVPV